MWDAGLDWADQHHDLVISDETGRNGGQGRVEQTPEGRAHLVTFLKDLAPRDPIACVGETLHGWLMSTVLEAGVTGYPVTPKTVDRTRAASGARTDLIDASLLATHGRLERADLRRLEPESPKSAEINARTRDQDAVIQGQTRLGHQLTACLNAYDPAALHLFRTVQQRSALLVVPTYPTTDAAAAASVAELETTLKKGGQTRAGPGAPTLFEMLHQPHVHADAVTTRTNARLTRALVEHLLPLAEDDKALADLVVTHAERLIVDSLPGTGTRLAPRLLAAWGDDRARFAEARSIQALAGTCPVPWKSGEDATVPLRCACLKPVRTALHHVAWLSTHQEPWAQASSQRTRAEGTSHRMAVGALAHARVRVIVALWNTREGSPPATFESAQRLHARQGA